MPKMCKDGVTCNAEASQIPAMLKAGWEEFGKPTVAKEATKEKSAPPSIKASRKTATPDMTNPASFKVTKSESVWSQKDKDTLNGEQVAASLMEQLEFDLDLILWAEGNEVKLASTREEVEFDISFDKPRQSL